jgi:hypothetical protein
MEIQDLLFWAKILKSENKRYFYAPFQKAKNSILITKNVKNT